jgi:hypothetical protein
MTLASNSRLPPPEYRSVKRESVFQKIDLSNFDIKSIPKYEKTEE